MLMPGEQERTGEWFNHESVSLPQLHDVFLRHRVGGIIVSNSSIMLMGDIMFTISKDGCSLHLTSDVPMPEHMARKATGAPHHLQLTYAADITAHHLIIKVGYVHEPEPVFRFRHTIRLEGGMSESNLVHTVKAFRAALEEGKAKLQQEVENS